MADVFVNGVGSSIPLFTELPIKTFRVVRPRLLPCKSLGSLCPYEHSTQNYHAFFMPLSKLLALNVKMSPKVSPWFELTD